MYCLVLVGENGRTINMYAVAVVYAIRGSFTDTAQSRMLLVERNQGKDAVEAIIIDTHLPTQLPSQGRRNATDER